MKITKGAEPTCLTATRTQYRATHGAVDDGAWESLAGTCKQAMREVAWREQGGLCAYCMSPLSGDHAAKSQHPQMGGMKLEHFEARNAAGHRTLAWDNLLGVCPGVVVGQSVDETGTDETGTAHCDTYRGNLPTAQQALAYSPAKVPPDVGALYRYDKAQGRILSDNADATQDIARLNLNLARLKRNRLAVLDMIRRQLEVDDSTARLLKLRQDYAQKDGNGRLRSYANVGLWYVGHKLRQRGVP
ncbi:hypothetical protein POL68_28770 [Stigmatella sp. ncwal1]|uniref:TIGR02646 family protein n=1 Tax=Stigmatella ashevillensis TaxID=2995309 RepID=A0ABT5DH88_9BACT|nr:hypothetical protein [Stigmatella ashevillena]MDC0712490.1 hypothetical protein [Stigmatella ashevillena]